MLSKPDKYGQKLWLAVDVDTKYLLKVMPYLGKDNTRPGRQSLSEHVVMQLMEPFLNKGLNVTPKNYFRSLQLARMLKQKGTSIVGTVKKYRRKNPKDVRQSRRALLNTFFEE
jgi:hypothetical protein